MEWGSKSDVHTVEPVKQKKVYNLMAVQYKETSCINNTPQYNIMHKGENGEYRILGNMPSNINFGKATQLQTLREIERECFSLLKFDTHKKLPFSLKNDKRLGSEGYLLGEMPHLQATRIV